MECWKQIVNNSEGDMGESDCSGKFNRIAIVEAFKEKKKRISYMNS